MMGYHVPVLVEEALEGLGIHQGGVYVDGTLGGGGHFLQMIARLEQGVVIGIDVDTDAVGKVTNDLLQLGFAQTVHEEPYAVFVKGEIHVILVHANFQDILPIVADVAQIVGIPDMRVDGFLFDLGVSSHQIDVKERGFSYMQNGPLDMRMDTALQVSAADLVNGLYEKELVKMLEMYGEERYAKRIARGITKARQKQQITTSQQLCEVIKRSVPFHYSNPYARTFQALRIAVNDELGSLERLVERIPSVVQPGGRLAFIAFHSLEDRIVKQAFKDNTAFKEVTPMVRPLKDEIDENKRARSAKLRIYEKVK